MSDSLRVAFRTLGCKVNRVESEDIAADLLGRGATLSEEGEADVVVVNTCTVTGEADAKARKAIRQVLSAPSDPIVVVTGCLASIDPDALESLGDRVVVEADKELVADRVADILRIEAKSGHGHVVRAGEGFRTRALLKIEDGCDVFCSYCVVPHARGIPRSVPLAEVVRASEELVTAGAREIVLTGINLGRYRDGAVDLAAVVEAVAHTGVARLRLSSIEPPDLSERLLDVLASTPAFCRHLHIPLQSGSDAVLAAMRRTYRVDTYREILSAASAALEGASFTTDVMVGFPGESDEDAAQTRALCEEIGFSKLHVFRYSRRSGTPAAEMPQVDPSIRTERARLLRDVGAQLQARFLASQIGLPAELLVEREGPDWLEGVTRNYVRARVDRTALAGLASVGPGDTVDVTLSEGDPRAGILAAVPILLAGVDPPTVVESP